MKKSVKFVSLLLAALLIATTLIGVFSSVVYGTVVVPPGPSSSSSSSSSSSALSSSSAASSSSSSSSSSSDSSSTPSDNRETTANLRWNTYPAFYHRGGGNPTTRLVKNRVYRVSMQFVDNSVQVDEMDELFDQYAKRTGPIAWSDLLTVYVESTGGNFAVVPHPDYEDDMAGVDLDFHLMYVGSTSSGHPIFDLSFYAEPDGAGKTISLNIEYEYKDSNGNWDSRNGTLCRTIPEVFISDNSDVDSSDSSEDETYLIGTPNIIITSYNYGGNAITGGESFPLTIQFENTSPELGLENIIMDVTTSADLTISNGSNSMFLDQLAVGESSQRTLQISTTASAKPEPQQVTVKFSFEYILNKKREKGERTEVIAIPMVQPDRFSLGTLVVPDQIWPGESTYLSVDYVNKGKTDIYNLAARLETDVPGVGESQNIGNITAGNSGTIDFTITMNDPGTITGTVFVTYEDAKGEEKTSELPFTATVMDMGGMGGMDPPVDLPMEPTEPEGLSTPAKVMACGGGLMVAGLVFTAVVKKAKAKRDEGSDEDI